MRFCWPNKPLLTYNVQDLKINVKEWIVQPKWDGHRAIPHCDEQGKVTVYSREKKLLTLAGKNWGWLGMLPLPRPWGLDAEMTRDGRMIVWDFYLLGGVVRYNEPYINRLRELQKLIPNKMCKDRFSVELIETLPGAKYRNFMMRRSEPCLEGFVLKDPQATDLWGVRSTTDTPSMFKYRF